MAGSWSESTPVAGYREGSYTGVRRMTAQFTADAADASVPALEVGGDDSGGFIQRMTVVFDGTTPPTGASLKVIVTDSSGIAVSSTDALTASSNITINSYYVGKLYVNVTGNETNSAKATVNLYVR